PTSPVSTVHRSVASHVAPRVPPPSSPTRRSSDLRAAAAGPAGAGLRQADARGVSRAAPMDGGVDGRRLAAIRRALLRHYDRHRRDRKSTRLNSSHVKISYAVFCLKKKKTAFTTNI